MLAYDQRDNLSFNQADQGSIIIIIPHAKTSFCKPHVLDPEKIYIKKATPFFIVENAGIEAMKLQFSNRD